MIQMTKTEALLQFVNLLSYDDKKELAIELISSLDSSGLGYNNGLHVTFGDGNLSVDEDDIKYALGESDTDFKEYSPIGAMILACIKDLSVKDRIAITLLTGYGQSICGLDENDDLSDFHFYNEKDKDDYENLRENCTALNIFKEINKYIYTLMDKRGLAYTPFTHNTFKTYADNGLRNPVKQNHIIAILSALGIPFKIELNVKEKED